MRLAVACLALVACSREAPPHAVQELVPGQPGKSGPGGELTIVPQAEDATPLGSGVISLGGPFDPDAGATALWLGEPSPSTKNYLLLGASCDYYVAYNGENLRHWHRCDQAFGMCFFGCGQRVGAAVPFGDQREYTRAAIACALDCERSIPVPLDPDAGRS